VQVNVWKDPMVLTVAVVAGVSVLLNLILIVVLIVK